jgi:hypothetical protein
VLALQSLGIGWRRFPFWVVALILSAYIGSRFPDNYETKWADDIPWLFSTRGLGEIVIDATVLTGLTDD